MTRVSTTTRLLLALSGIKGVGQAALKKVSAVPGFWQLGLVEWSDAVPQIRRAIAGRDTGIVWDEAGQWADDQVAAAENADARIISPLDPEYPKLLAETRDDPYLLFVKGKLAAENQQSVAIIGTREPTPHGMLIAQRITQFFVERRWSVISGLAMGCDAIAHQAAIDAGGHTVAVLAHGLQMIAPSRHKKLAQDILDAGGALVSEYPFGRDVIGAQFVKRDRTQAGLAQGVVMVQSDIKGGSLFASRAALDYRRWLAVPYPTDKDRENGESKVQANLVIADGADAEKAHLLHCPISSLRMVKVVHGREDYLRLVEEGANATTERPLTAHDAAYEVLPGPADETLNTPVMQSDVGAPEKSAEVSAANRQPVEMESKTPSYYLEVSPEDLASLKTTRLPVGDLESAANTGRAVDADMRIAIVRLENLQSKLDNLRKVHVSERPMEEARALRCQFQVEDVLVQMKFAADQLLKLDGRAHGQLLRAILLKQGSARQHVLPLTSETPGSLRDAPMVDVLNSLVGALPRSVSVGGLTSSDRTSDKVPHVEVHLSDLVLSFIDLIKAALPQGSHKSTTTVDG